MRSKIVVIDKVLVGACVLGSLVAALMGCLMFGLASGEQALQTNIAVSSKTSSFEFLAMSYFLTAIFYLAHLILVAFRTSWISSLSQMGLSILIVLQGRIANASTPSSLPEWVVNHSSFWSTLFRFDTAIFALSVFVLILNCAVLLNFVGSKQRKIS